MSNEPVSTNPHVIDGEFQSDKYPSCPRGKVPLSCKDTTAQDLLWEYAQRRRKVDAQFSEGLEKALKIAGYKPPVTTEGGVSEVADTDISKRLGHFLDEHFNLAAADPRDLADAVHLWFLREGYTRRPAAPETPREDLAAILKDANAVHMNILRGTIKLTRDQALHIACATDYDSFMPIRLTPKETKGCLTTQEIARARIYACEAVVNDMHLIAGGWKRVAFVQ